MSPLIISSPSLALGGSGGIQYFALGADNFAQGILGNPEAGISVYQEVFGIPGVGFLEGKPSVATYVEPLRVISCASAGIVAQSGQTNCFQHGFNDFPSGQLSGEMSIGIRPQSVVGLLKHNPAAALPGGFWYAFDLLVPSTTLALLFAGSAADGSKQIKFHINRKGGTGWPRNLVIGAGRSGPGSAGRIDMYTDSGWRFNTFGIPAGINKDGVVGGGTWQDTPFSSGVSGDSGDQWWRFIMWNRSYPDATKATGLASDNKVYMVRGDAPGVAVEIFDWPNSVGQLDNIAPPGTNDGALYYGGGTDTTYGNPQGIRMGIAVHDNQNAAGGDPPITTRVYTDRYKAGTTLESVL